MKIIPKPARVKSWQGKGVVVEIHDGDTFTANIDLGFRIFFNAAVRVHGINAPELTTLEGHSALVFAQTLLKPGDIVQLDSRRLD